MWNKPTEKQLSELPALYATDSTPVVDKTIVMHFFMGSCDWWIVEYDPEDRLFFGFACLGDPQCAEWGYISLDGLVQAQGRYGAQVDREVYWKPRTVSEIPEMCALL
jgi:hypothetical protein